MNETTLSEMRLPTNGEILEQLQQWFPAFGHACVILDECFARHDFTPDVKNKLVFYLYRIVCFLSQEYFVTPRRWQVEFTYMLFEKLQKLKPHQYADIYYLGNILKLGPGTGKTYAIIVISLLYLYNPKRNGMCVGEQGMVVIMQPKNALVQEFGNKIRMMLYTKPEALVLIDTGIRRERKEDGEINEYFNWDKMFFSINRQGKFVTSEASNLHRMLAKVVNIASYTRKVTTEQHNIIVCTPEKALQLMVRILDPNLNNTTYKNQYTKFRCLLMDEAHYIMTPDRGMRIDTTVVMARMIGAPTYYFSGTFSDQLLGTFEKNLNSFPIDIQVSANSTENYPVDVHECSGSYEQFYNPPEQFKIKGVFTAGVIKISSGSKTGNVFPYNINISFKNMFSYNLYSLIGYYMSTGKRTMAFVNNIMQVEAYFLTVGLMAIAMDMPTQRLDKHFVELLSRSSITINSSELKRVLIPAIKNEVSSCKDMINRLNDFLNAPSRIDLVSRLMISCYEHGIALKHAQVHIPEKDRADLNTLLDKFITDTSVNAPLRVLLCTSSILEGINPTPIDVLITDPRSYSQLKSEEQRQLCGRVGRTRPGTIFKFMMSKELKHSSVNPYLNQLEFPPQVFIDRIDYLRQYMIRERYMISVDGHYEIDPDFEFNPHRYSPYGVFHSLIPMGPNIIKDIEEAFKTIIPPGYVNDVMKVSMDRQKMAFLAAFIQNVKEHNVLQHKNLRDENGVVNYIIIGIMSAITLSFDTYKIYVEHQITELTTITDMVAQCLRNAYRQIYYQNLDEKYSRFVYLFSSSLMGFVTLHDTDVYSIWHQSGSYFLDLVSQFLNFTDYTFENTHMEEAKVAFIKLKNDIKILEDNVQRMFHAIVSENSRGEMVNVRIHPKGNLVILKPTDNMLLGDDWEPVYNELTFRTDHVPNMSLSAFIKAYYGVSSLTWRAFKQYKS